MSRAGLHKIRPKTDTGRAIHRIPSYTTGDMNKFEHMSDFVDGFTALDVSVNALAVEGK
jgi:hypothetical protein